MCTVTYVPLASGAIITANRDEAPSRNASGLSEYDNASGEPFLIAKEPIHGGTNLAIGKSSTNVLLNGAFDFHESKISYRRSRGLIVLDSLNLGSLSRFRRVDFEGVEPFTLLRFGDEIEELRWDEKKIHLLKRSVTDPFIVASAKLYSQEVRTKRGVWFDRLVRESDINARRIMRFHLEGGDGDIENDMTMNRGGFVQTVSVSQVVLTNPRLITHYDLINDHQESVKLALR